MFRGIKDKSLEDQFDGVDSALYNIKEDPEERIDLKSDHPEIFQILRLA